MSATDIARARDALFSIDPAIPRAEWARVAMAAKAAGLSFDEFDGWSSSADNYDAAGARDTWRSVSADGGIQAGTLFHMARQCGWDGKSGTSRPTQAPKPAPKPKPVDVEAAWSRFEPVSEHSYITAKDGLPDGLRIAPEGDPLRIAGHAVAGWLAVPAYDADGVLQSLQFIPEPGHGKKLNMPGCTMAGGRFVVGDLAAGGDVYLVEGIGQAWACHRATGRAAVCCFGAGNIARVVESMAGDYSLVIVPDVGQEAEADRIAAAHGCKVARLPAGEATNFDINDFTRREGEEAAEGLLLAAAPAGDVSEQPEGVFLPVSVTDVFSNPAQPPQFAWGELLPRGTTTLFSAHGGTGKSTIALMLAVAVAGGMGELFGQPAAHGPAVFVSLEDSAAIVRHRLAGICSGLRIAPGKLAADLCIMDGTQWPELYAAESRHSGELTAGYLELLKIARELRPVLIVVDNASDAYGGDEIARRQVRAFMRGLNRLAAESGAAVVLLAHVDKSTSRSKDSQGEGYSGSTAWHNSARSRLFMQRTDSGNLEIEHQKSNYGRLMKNPIRLEWPVGGLPILMGDTSDPAVTQARAYRDRMQAAGLLRLLDEYAGRGQFAGTSISARNNPRALLQSDPQYKALQISKDDHQRLLTTCQREGWLEAIEYRTSDRKTRERWYVTEAGQAVIDEFAPSAPSAPS